MKNRLPRSSCVRLPRTILPLPAAAAGLAARLTSAPVLVPDRTGSTLAEAGQVARPAAARHLLLILGSAEHRQGAGWETAGFLALWFSGLVGVAVSLL
jgi:hypothetical protein